MAPREKSDIEVFDYSDTSGAAASGSSSLSSQENILRLQKNVATLSSRCARLESQNILVSVQQLDIAARVTANFLSLSCLLFYWWIVYKIPICAKTLVEYTITISPVPVPAVVMSVLPILIIWIFKIALGCYPYIYNRITHNVTHRRFEVFAVAFIIIGRTKLARYREHHFAIKNNGTINSKNNSNETEEAENKEVPHFGEDTNSDAIWDANYEISARFLYVSILRLKGLWIKTAQYMSSRADFVPVAYVRELKRLQDEAPATAWADINIPRKIVKKLRDIDPVPIASASIGQVHVAYMKSTGEKVVIKVQHPSSRTLMTDDFWSLNIISRIVAWMDPEYEFLEILMKEWAKEARKELDFNAEAQNLLDARKVTNKMFDGVEVLETNAAASYDQPKSTPVPFQVEIPRPIMDLTTQDYLVMSFCEGHRVDDFQMMNKEGLTRDSVMDAVAQTFAYMMYTYSEEQENKNCSTGGVNIFNGDPHPGNIFLRKGTSKNKEEGFTLVLLDWGLAKRMPSNKRIAFCQMAYAAVTVDFGLLLDSFKSIGLKLKRENIAEDMEGMRFFLRDIAPSGVARKRIRAKIRTDNRRMKAREKGQKIPVDGKTYPSEFFFFIRVNELLHGLGSSMSINMAYLDVIAPYAKRGLQQIAPLDNKTVTRGSTTTQIPRVLQGKNEILTNMLQSTILNMKLQQEIEGIQLCVLKGNECLVNIAEGTLGGLKTNIPMTSDALILGFSCTKAVAATVAHMMIQEGYFTLDDFVHMIWPQFCPMEECPSVLASALDKTEGEVHQQWEWKRSITVRHILAHQSGMWLALPANLTVGSMSSCEKCSAAMEYNEDRPEDTMLPTHKPGDENNYHFMSFGWLVAGVCTASYRKKYNETVTFEYLVDKFVCSRMSSTEGFQPCGWNGKSGVPLAQTTTSNLRASSALQKRRELEAIGENNDDSGDEKTNQMKILLNAFSGKEFLLDPRIWNCQDVLKANVPSAGGRFSAIGLARFYSEIGKFMNDEILERATSPVVVTKRGSSLLQGVTALTTQNSTGEDNDIMSGLGYQLFKSSRDNSNEQKQQGNLCFGHAGVGGSIGIHHKKSGLSIADRKSVV